MKHFIQLLLIFTFSLSSFSSANTESSFQFKVKKTENNMVEARFQLTKNVIVEKAKEQLLSINKVISFNELDKEEKYYQIKYHETTSLDEIRKVFLSLDADFDKKFIIVTNKSFYSN